MLKYVTYYVYGRLSTERDDQACLEGGIGGRDHVSQELNRAFRVSRAKRMYFHE